MAAIYNPWQQPPNTGVLPPTLPLATPELMAPVTDPLLEMEELGESGAGDSMTQALSVIQQQSQLISQLMSMLAPGDSRGN